MKESSNKSTVGDIMKVLELNKAYRDTVVRNILRKEFDLNKTCLDRIMIGGRKTKPRILKTHITNRKLKVAIIGDTHLCSWYEAINELHTFYAICKKEGVKHVVHAGDILDGGMSHAGWENEIHTFGADRQVKYLVKNYPKVNGIKTYFITGSHDHSFWKRGGHNVGQAIDKQRPDLTFLGMSAGDIRLGSVKIKLVHPSGGMPYALSYRGQKISEHIAPGTKPHILAVGHLHTAYYFHYRNMHVIGVGAFQKQTPYLVEKSLMPDVGGWICSIHLDKNGGVVAFTPSWITFP